MPPLGEIYEIILGRVREVAWDFQATPDLEHLMDFNRSGRIMFGQGIDRGPSFSLARSFGKIS